MLSNELLYIYLLSNHTKQVYFVLVFISFYFLHIKFDYLYTQINYYSYIMNGGDVRTGKLKN